MATEKKSKPKPAATGNGTIDIDHEVVQSPQLNAAAAAANPEDQIKKEIAKFNLADAAIEAYKKKYGALQINGQEDKDGYKSVKVAWNEVRSIRTGLEKKGLELRNQYKVITSAISKEEDRLIDLVTPLEEDLYGKWKAVDDEKERVKKEQEEAEQRQAMIRVEEVLSLGMEFKDGFYVIGETISMDVATLRSLPEDKYAGLKARISAKAAEIKKAEEEAAEKKRQEQAEFKRQQDELKQKQDQLAEDQRKMREQQEQLQKDREDAAKIKRDNRINKLVALGMTYNQRGDLFEFDNGFKSVTHDGATLFGLDDYGFDEHTKVIAGLIQESKDGKVQHDAEVEKEKQALENHKKFIAATMDRAGFNFSYTAQSFTWEDKNTAIEVKFAELIPLSEPEISDKAEALKIKIQEAEKLTADNDKKAKAAADKEAKLALGDKDRYAQEHAAIAAAATKMVPGEFKTKKYQQRAQAFLERLTNLLNEFE